MDQILETVKREDVRLYETFIKEEITDEETFLLLDNDDFKRLQLTTKMVKTIQKYQKLLTNDLEVEPIDDAKDAEEHNVSTCSNRSSEPIKLEKEINVALLFSQTENGRKIQEYLAEGTKPTEKIIKTINCILCDFLASNYGVRASTFYKEMLACSLVKTYPILGSTVTDIPHALWFHKNGRGEGRHAGKIHYRMELLAKKSESRVIHRQHADNPSTSTSNVSEIDQGGMNIDDLVHELQFAVPSEQTNPRIKDLWNQTLKYRNERRSEETFLQFMMDFPVASAFGGELISLEFELMKPAAAPFEDTWNNLQPKILGMYRDVHRYIKNDIIKALSVVRDKNPTRGAKRPREKGPKDEEARKLNPLQGVIEWIDLEVELPAPDVPLIIIAEKLFEVGDCYVVWKDVSIPVGKDLLGAFILLCQAFVVFDVKCCPSDKLFYSFFYASCFKIEALSTTGNKFLNQLV